MDPQSWKRVDELFHRALELAPNERERFLREQCADDEPLRAEVLALLAADAGTERFLTPPSPETFGKLVGGTASGPREGSRLGAWTLVDCIGSGAMGTVWRANRTDRNYDQTVAIKLLPVGTSSPGALERFRRERQALARLNHPHIARLLDGGTTDEGLPYLVMELIAGLPVDDYCREGRLSIPDRLALFLSVCGAVHYAHQNLVVHRDLKPSNILVDPTGSPKLLDFGIAKLLESSDSSLTSTGERLMTPQYASPEQVRGEPVTTATDVYSLGVLLYELLTGLSPYRTPAGTLREIETAVTGQVPERPSLAATRPPTDGARREGSPEARAAHRQTRPDRLRRRLSGDLDRIVLMALRKEPDRRYGSAEQLADDVRRHLKGLPVIARNDTWSYRTAKFLRRHRVGTSAAVVVLVVLVSAAVAITRSAGIASERLTAVLRLSDLTRLADYAAAADLLWPAHPKRLADLERWVDQSRDLARNLPLHRASLESLRSRALPYDEEAREHDRLSHPDAERLDGLRVRRSSTQSRIQSDSPDKMELQSRLSEIEAEIASLERVVTTRRTWRFASVEDQWQHDKLAELVSGLEALMEPERGLISRVQGRLETARSLERISILEHAEEWRSAIASIANVAECPEYRGLAIQPQLGLVPLGRNHRSGLWEFAHVSSGEVPRLDEDGQPMLTSECGLVFVLIPAGSFRMGAENSTAGRPQGDGYSGPGARPDESPVNAITLTAFFLSKYEMTQGQWLRFTGRNPSVYPPGQRHGEVVIDLLHPVEQVAWEDCDRVLSQMGLCLPTEAQWEYAARAGTITPWWTGGERDSLAGAANLADRSALRAGVPWPTVRDWPDLDDGHVVHAPVDAFRPNPWGLFNVTGNVWEWCADDYARYDLPVEAGTGRRLWKGTSVRCGRGGSFMDAAVSVRSAHRGHGAVDALESSIGVRPARVLE